MKILALDTSLAACSVALCDGDKVAFLHQVAPMQQAVLILPMIHELLGMLSLTVNELDAIAYGCGPGNFTGIRIASCVAQGLAFTKQLPIIRISTLAVIAQTAYEEHAWNKQLVAVDARTNQVYWAMYEWDETAGKGYMKLINKEELCTPQSVTRPDGQDWYAVGDGWGKYQAALIDCLKFEPKMSNISILPTASALLKLAKWKYKEGDWVSTIEALPNYLR